MGITIHYKGQLKNLTQSNSVIDELKDISEIMNWKFSIMDNDWNKPMTAEFLHFENRVEITGHLPLKGIRINPHPNCESFSILFDKDGYLQSVVLMVLNHENNQIPGKNYLSIKTQFAPTEIHISIIKLLKYLKNKYIPDLEVFDEGSYWETENKELLIEKISFLNKKMDMVEDIISSISVDKSKMFRDEVINLIEKTLREKLK